jgi:hypothetical protein
LTLLKLGLFCLKQKTEVRIQTTDDDTREPGSGFREADSVERIAFKIWAPVAMSSSSGFMITIDV